MIDYCTHKKSERVSCIGQEAVFLTQDVESVELVEQLHERTLDLAFCSNGLC